MKDGTTNQRAKLMCTRNLNEEISSVINRETSAHTGQTGSKTHMLMEESVTTQIVSSGAITMGKHTPSNTRSSMDNIISSLQGQNQQHL